MKRLLTWMTATPMVLLAAMALLLCCCTSSWLPDSSGFVTVDLQGRVIRFDLATGREQQLLAGQPGSRMSGGAVSPDGQRFAVARMVGLEERTQVQLSVYSLAGKRLQAAEPVNLPLAKDTPALLPVHCSWSPDGRYVLVCPFGNQTTALCYDLTTQQTQEFADVMPLGLVGFEALPIRNAAAFVPDSSGFLAFPTSELAGPQATAVPSIQLCQLDPAAPARTETLIYTAAARQQITRSAENATPAAEGQPSENKSSEKTPREKTPRQRVQLPVRWSQDKLLMSWGRGYLVVDPGAKTVDYRDDAEIAKLAAYAQRHEVYVVDRLGDRLVVQIKAAGQPIEVADRETGEVRGRVELPEQQGIPVSVAVAPNGQYLLVTSPLPQPRYWVLDATGKRIHQGTTGSKIVSK